MEFFRKNARALRSRVIKCDLNVRTRGTPGDNCLHVDYTLTRNGTRAWRAFARGVKNRAAFTRSILAFILRRAIILRVNTKGEKACGGRIKASWSSIMRSFSGREDLSEDHYSKRRWFSTRRRVYATELDDSSASDRGAKRSKCNGESFRDGSVRIRYII